MKERGRSQRRYCIAHIWCWPTPVVQIMSSRPLGQRLQRSRARAAASAGRPRRRSGAGTRRASRRAGRARAWSGTGRPSAFSASNALASSARICFSGPTTGMSALPQLPDLGGVDVEVDDRRARRERVESLPVTRSSKRAPTATSTSHLFIAQFDHFGAVHARPAEVELVRLREGALGHQRRDDRQLPQLGERAQLVARLGVDRPAADVEHGPLARRRSPALRREPASR